MTTAKKKQDKPTVIKKYANRRLYDTGRSSYVTLDDLCQLVKEGHDFVVYDAKSGEDLTRAVLTQIIVDQESKEGQQQLLPTSFLRQLIGFYGDTLQPVIPNYLEQAISSFTNNQEQFRTQVSKSLGGIMLNPVTAFEELNRKNVEMFETALRTWSPFTAPTATRTASTPDDKIKDLKRNISEMQKEIDRLSSGR